MVGAQQKGAKNMKIESEGEYAEALHQQSQLYACAHLTKREEERLEELNEAIKEYEKEEYGD
jgi:hypothetical protein